jgi:hypothetical protein
MVVLLIGNHRQMMVVLEFLTMLLKSLIWLLDVGCLLLNVLTVNVNWMILHLAMNIAFV